ncbi:MAG: NAD(P)-binding protein [Nitrospira sp.]|nr:NAD(P)-binding protein [Nitrospira sp.]
MVEHGIGDGRRVRIVCVGAGFSGIAVGIQVRDKLPNADIQIYDKATDVGGVCESASESVSDPPRARKQVPRNRMRREWPALHLD